MAYARIPDDRVGTVYLIHFSAPTSKGRQHYLGWSSDVAKRFARHQSGHGAEQTRKAVSEGLKLILAQTWRGTKADEKRIKREARWGYACLCPHCDAHDPRTAKLIHGMGPATLRVRRAPRAVPGGARATSSR